ncbi:hypothetical protein ILP92_08940 [Maribius pontilimi]|uniref:Uncharacterized protein n=1 Tax=Palleronia pontilimi TaxID=1964209 RepID=A0A934IJ38_9RHOB|nr:hypothetical protein [Palleronia pontilimi]MBJ3762869.1 hypothetical protein [Palleronia pontilimi]
MRSKLLIPLAFLTAGSATAQGGAPLSAIDWLSDSVALPAAMPIPEAPSAPEPPVTDNALPEAITVTRLEDLDAAPPGLFPAAARDLPQAPWSATELSELQARMGTLRPPHLATTQDLLHDLLAAQTDWPGSPDDAQLAFLARIDGLLAVGAVDPARTLLDLAGREKPRNFRRWFDIALLTGQENAGCSAMRRLPEITPTYTARVFCLARGGDWPAAALTLETATSLDVIDAAAAERLRLFLDDLADTPTLPPPSRPTPLDFAIYGAVGEPLRTASLPLAFAHADLRPITGWKARIEAAERLTRAGAIPARRLWEVYGERLPAASGGVWDRVDAVQRLDRALETGDPGAVSSALPLAWAALRDADLGQALARQHAGALGRLPLTGDASRIAAEMALIDGRDPVSPLPPFLTALHDASALDTVAETPLQVAIADGLNTEDMPAASVAMIDEGRIGIALLDAIDLLDQGATGNLDALRHGLALMRAAGQPERARRAAIEIAILEPPA